MLKVFIFLFFFLNVVQADRIVLSHEDGTTSNDNGLFKFDGISLRNGKYLLEERSGGTSEFTLIDGRIEGVFTYTGETKSEDYLYENGYAQEFCYAAVSDNGTNVLKKSTKYRSESVKESLLIECDKKFDNCHLMPTVKISRTNYSSCSSIVKSYMERNLENYCYAAISKDDGATTYGMYSGSLNYKKKENYLDACNSKYGNCYSMPPKSVADISECLSVVKKYFNENTEKFCVLASGDEGLEYSSGFSKFKVKQAALDRCNNRFSNCRIIKTFTVYSSDECSDTVDSYFKKKNRAISRKNDEMKRKYRENQYRQQQYQQKQTVPYMPILLSN